MVWNFYLRVGFQHIGFRSKRQNQSALDLFTIVLKLQYYYRSTQLCFFAESHQAKQHRHDVTFRSMQLGKVGRGLLREAFQGEGVGRNIWSLSRIIYVWPLAPLTRATNLFLDLPFTYISTGYTTIPHLETTLHYTNKPNPPRFRGVLRYLKERGENKKGSVLKSGGKHWNL